MIDHLLATCERAEDGVTWFSAPELLPIHQREIAPDGYYNCGLAHGVPGVIALLGRIADAGLDPRAAPTCMEALRWLHAQRLPPDPRGRFPGTVGRGLAPVPARTAWCYGDPGIAIAAFGASRRIGAPHEVWLELALEAGTRSPELCRVRDAGLCHGTAGLGHICNRFYQATKDDRFRERARAWFQRALAMRRSEGVGGFASWTALQPTTALGWVDDAGLVEGAAGVALALLGAVQPVEPAWDRMLACDL